MMTVLWLLVVLLLAVIAMAVLILYLRQRDQTRREAIEALAARRGWSLMITSQSLGRPSILRLSSRSGPAWQAETRRFEASSATKAQNITEYHSTATHWPEHLMILCPAPQNDAQVPAPEHAAPDGFSEEQLHALVGQDIGETFPPMQPWPAPDGMTIIASTDPALRTDLGDLAKIYLNWTPLHHRGKGHPVVILGDTGLRVRLRHAVNGADGLEQFIDYATALYRHLSRP